MMRKARYNHAKGVMAWVPWLALRLGGPSSHEKSRPLGYPWGDHEDYFGESGGQSAADEVFTRCLRGVERRGPAQASRKCAAASAAPY